MLSTGTRALRGRVRETGPLEISPDSLLANRAREKVSKVLDTPCNSIFVGHEEEEEANFRITSVESETCIGTRSILHEQL